MTIKTTEFKISKLPKSIRNSGNQLHVLEFDVDSLICDLPIEGTKFDDEEIVVDMKKLRRHLEKVTDRCYEDIYVSSYGFDGTGLLIDFRDIDLGDKPVSKACPEVPGVIVGAIAYAANLGFTAIAIVDYELLGGRLYDRYPGIEGFITEGLEEQGFDNHLAFLSKIS